MADLPLDLDPALAERLARALDVEGKIPTALEALGPVAGRDVVVVDVPPGIRTGQLESLGARVTIIASDGAAAFDAPDASADVVIGFWSSFRQGTADESVPVRRLLRPGGRLLIVHDYGRDDVSRLRGDRPEYGTWSRRDGPFLGGGFKVRVIHCWWTFDSLDEMRAFLSDAFGPGANEVAASLNRPRLSYNLAVYHRGFDEEAVA